MGFLHNQINLCDTPQKNLVHFKAGRVGGGGKMQFPELSGDSVEFLWARLGVHVISGALIRRDYHFKYYNSFHIRFIHYRHTTFIADDLRLMRRNNLFPSMYARANRSRWN